MFSFLVFFILVYLFTFAKHLSLWAAFGVGIIVDVSLARPYGFSGFNFLFFLLCLNLYQQKYSQVNQLFLLLLLCLASLLWLYINQLTLTANQVFWFSLFYFVLVLLLRLKQERELKKVE